MFFYIIIWNYLWLAAPFIHAHLKWSSVSLLIATLSSCLQCTTALISSELNHMTLLDHWLLVHVLTKHFTGGQRLWWMVPPLVRSQNATPPYWALTNATPTAPNCAVAAVDERHGCGDLCALSVLWPQLQRLPQFRGQFGGKLNGVVVSY